MYVQLQQHTFTDYKLDPLTVPACALVCQPFGLSRTETLQVLNLAPVSAVEVHLIVENAEGRLGEERIAELLDVVAAHSPVAVQKRAGSVDDAAAAEADG